MADRIMCLNTFPSGGHQAVSAESFWLHVGSRQARGYWREMHPDAVDPLMPLDDAEYAHVVSMIAGYNGYMVDQAMRLDHLGWADAFRKVAADEQAEDEWAERQIARGELAGSPETMGCYACGGFDGVTAPQRKVVALGPVAEPQRDPTQTYRLECGHTAI